MAPTDSGPLYWPISLYGDDGWALRVEMVDDQDPPQPIPLTGRTYTAHVRRSPTATVVETIMLVDTSEAAQGVITLRIPQPDVRELEGYWDLQEQIGADPPTTLLAGPVSWRADVTR